MRKWSSILLLFLAACATQAPVTPPPPPVASTPNPTSPTPPPSGTVVITPSAPEIVEAELAPNPVNQVDTAELVVDVAPSPDPYYGAYHGLTGAALKRHLHLVIRNHTRISYQAVWDALEVTDQCDSAENNVLLIYSQRSQPKFQRDRGTSYNYTANGYTLIDSWNREHVWPKSHGFPNESDTAYTDLHHMKPADRSINSARNTRSFDYADEIYMDNGGTIPTPCKTSRTKYAWEPPDAVKGDIARMMFYMVVRYEGPAYDLELVDYVVPNNNRLPILGVLSVLIQWHNLDPVDDRERRRNQIIYEHYQGNRNPFIDHPEFVALIWE